MTSTFAVAFSVTFAVTFSIAVAFAVAITFGVLTYVTGYSGNACEVISNVNDFALRGFVIDVGSTISFSDAIRTDNLLFTSGFDLGLFNKLPI